MCPHIENCQNSLKHVHWGLWQEAYVLSLASLSIRKFQKMFAKLPTILNPLKIGFKTSELLISKFPNPGSILLINLTKPDTFFFAFLKIFSLLSFVPLLSHGFPLFFSSNPFSVSSSASSSKMNCLLILASLFPVLPW